MPFGTPIFGRFEHKIGVFVRFCQQVSSRCCRSSSLHGTQCRVSRGAATLPHRLPLRSMDCRCSDIANLSAHLHRLPTPPAYLRRMRLQPGRGRCQMANDVAAPRGMHRGKPHRGKTHCGNALLGTYHPRTQPRGRAARERTVGTHPGECTAWVRTVRRILFAGFEALCVFGYLELVYHLLNLTIHKDRQVVG